MGKQVKKQDILEKLSAEQVLAGNYSNMQDARKWASKFETQSDLLEEIFNFDFPENIAEDEYNGRDSVSEIFDDLGSTWTGINLTNGDSFDTDAWNNFADRLRNAKKALDQFNKSTNFVNLQNPKMQAIYAFFSRFDAITDTMDDLELDEAPEELNSPEHKLENQKHLLVKEGMETMQEEIDSWQEFGISGDPNVTSEEQLTEQIKSIEEENKFLEEALNKFTEIAKSEESDAKETEAALNKCKETSLWAEYALASSSMVEADDRIRELNKKIDETDKKFDEATDFDNPDSENADKYYNESKELQKDKKQLNETSQKHEDSKKRAFDELINMAGDDQLKIAQININAGKFDTPENVRNLDREAMDKIRTKAMNKYEELKESSVSSRDEIRQIINDIKNKLSQNDKMLEALVSARGRLSSFEEDKAAVNNNIEHVTEKLEKMPDDKRLDKLKDKLNDMYNEIDRGNRDGKHKDSEEFKRMKEALKAAKDNPTEQNLRALGEMSEKYLEEKTKGIHLSLFADKVRNQRLQFANDLKNLAKNNVNRANKLETAQSKQNARNAELDKIHNKFMPEFLRNALTPASKKKAHMKNRLEERKNEFIEIRDKCAKAIENRINLVSEVKQAKVSVPRHENKQIVNNNAPTMEKGSIKTGPKGFAPSNS